MDRYTDCAHRFAPHQCYAYPCAPHQYAHRLAAHPYAHRFAPHQYAHRLHCDICMRMDFECTHIWRAMYNSRYALALAPSHHCTFTSLQLHMLYAYRTRASHTFRPTMYNSESRIVSCDYRLAKSQLRITSHEQWVANSESRIASHEQCQATSELRIVSCD